MLSSATQILYNNALKLLIIALICLVILFYVFKYGISFFFETTFYLMQFVIGIAYYFYSLLIFVYVHYKIYDSILTRVN